MSVSLLKVHTVLVVMRVTTQSQEGEVLCSCLHIRSAAEPGIEVLSYDCALTAGLRRLSGAPVFSKNIVAMGYRSNYSKDRSFAPTLAGLRGSYTA